MTEVLRGAGGSIARKLTLVITVTAAVMVAVACAAVVGYDVVSARADFARDSEATAGVVGGNCAAAIAFGDAGAARRVLAALNAHPYIIEAAVFPLEGPVLATWSRSGAPVTPSLGADGALLNGDRLVVYRPILFDNERIGTMYIATSVDRLYQRLQRFLLATLVVLAIATATAFFVSARVQRLVSRPIGELAAAAKRVSSIRDYSVRVPRRSSDELGTLTDAFNEMLTQIQARDEALTKAHRRMATQLAQVEAEVTERKRAEQALRASEERFRQIAENIREVFWLTDPDTGQVMYISPAYESIWGRSCESLYASPNDWLAAVHADDHGRVAEAASDMRVQFDLEYRIVRPGGEVRWIRDRSFPIRDAEGRIFRVAGVAEDVTDARQLEAQLRHAQKLEAIGTLAGGVAHDFNNILGAILGYTDLALMDVGAGQYDVVPEQLTAVRTAGERARALVQQILAFSREQKQERKQLELPPLIQEALTLLRASLPSSVELRFDSAADVPAVMTDATEFHQVVMNLGTNAWHAMPDGGILEFSLTAVDVDADLARSHVDLAVGRYALLSVRDSGCGMDRATRERIFEPFFTTKAPGAGTGLGLSTVHGIVKRHGGAIAIDSEVGRGTTFRLYFPAAVARAAAPRPKVPTSDLRPGNGQHILLVDDEQPLVDWGRRALKRLGYRVTGYSNPLEAVAALTDHPEQFDLLVTDLTMPDFSGIKVAEIVQLMRPELPVILTTGNAGAITLDEARQYGVCELLPKPNTVKSLGDAIHRALTPCEAA